MLCFYSVLQDCVNWDFWFWGLKLFKDILEKHRSSGFQCFFKIGVLKKHVERKTSVLKFLFAIFLLQRMCFPVKFWRTYNFTENLWWLFLNTNVPRDKFRLHASILWWIFFSIKLMGFSCSNYVVQICPWYRW